MSTEQIAKRLSEGEACGISFEAFKKRIHHWDTCTEIGHTIGLKRQDQLADLTSKLTQSETRKFRGLEKRDRKRVLQSFRTRYTNGNGSRKIRNVFREAIRKVDPVVLETRKPKKQKTMVERFGISNPSKVKIPLIQKGGSTIDVNQMIPRGACRCQGCAEKDTCTPLILFRQHMAKVYA